MRRKLPEFCAAARTRSGALLPQSFCQSEQEAREAVKRLMKLVAKGQLTNRNYEVVACRRAGKGWEEIGQTNRAKEKKA